MSYDRMSQSIIDIEVKVENNEVYKVDKNKFTRNRKMNFKDFVWYLTFQRGRTTSMELDEYLKNKNDTYEISISKQAFSKQRQYLKPQIFIDITKDYLHDFYNNYPKEVKKYKGFFVCAVDGSVFEIPNTEELKKEYKSKKNGAGEKDSARARVSGIYDIENEFMLDTIITDYRQGEKELSKRNINEAKKIIDIDKTIIIFDRGYPAIDLIWTLQKLGAKFIFRLQTHMYDIEKRTMKTEDEWINLNVAGDRLRNIEDAETKKELKKIKTLDVRLTKVILNTGEIEYLLSNISEEIIPYEEMKEAYFKRWQIEIGYDILKNKLHIENFTGKTQITIEQDFYAQIYIFNVLQDIKHTANEKVQRDNENKKLKYEYKPNINILAGWLKNILIAIMFVETPEERRKLYQIIIDKAEKNLVPIKPNRTYERKFARGKRNKYKSNLRNNM